MCADRLLISVKNTHASEVLTDREQQFVDLLRRDPLMGSAALASALGTTRTSISVHLSNLGKKGVILGRGYVLSERPGAARPLAPPAWKTHHRPGSGLGKHWGNTRSGNRRNDQRQPIANYAADLWFH